MKIETEDAIIDPNSEIVLLVFDDDADRLRMIEYLSSMEPKEGRRVFAIYPAGTKEALIYNMAQEAISGRPKIITRTGNGISITGQLNR